MIPTDYDFLAPYYFYLVIGTFDEEIKKHGKDLFGYVYAKCMEELNVKTLDAINNLHEETLTNEIRGCYHDLIIDGIKLEMSLGL
ncbi:hypothetical protein D9M68_681310 [compost metagenome]